MKRYSYRIVVLGDTTGQDLTEKMSAAGKEGYRLISTIPGATATQPSRTLFPMAILEREEDE